MALSWPNSREPNNTYNPKHVDVITSTVEIFLDQSETQISVDPISLKESKNQNFPFPRFVTPHDANRGSRQPPSLPRSKSKFLSISLPNSASSSPRFSSGILRKKPKNQTQESPFSVARQHSVDLSRLRENHLQRSKSCGEGRAYAPSDDFDLCLTKVNGADKYLTSSNRNVNKADTHRRREKSTLDYDANFKCGALCLYLPSFTKGKLVKSRKEEPTMAHIISRTVSLEKFECGSWTSSAIVNDSEDDAEASKLYFDLPLELIRSSVNDANSPVRTAFVFEKDRKGVLKNASSRMGRKSHESSRQVRFSTSSPNSCSPSTSPCITPRLRKAREDFNAFLEAQSA